MPHLNPLLPLVLVEFVLVQNPDITHIRVSESCAQTDVDLNSSSVCVIRAVSPLREQLLTGQIAWCVHFLVVITILGLHRIGGQEDRCLRRTIDVII